MAWAERTGPTGRTAKRLFEPPGEAVLWAYVGSMESSRTASVCRVGYSKRDTDFGGGRPSGVSGSKLLFEVVSEADWPSPNKMA
jgi:hypothetical protein